MGTTDPIDRFERTFEGVDEDAKAPVSECCRCQARQ